MSQPFSFPPPPPPPPKREQSTQAYPTSYAGAGGRGRGGFRSGYGQRGQGLGGRGRGYRGGGQGRGSYHNGGSTQPAPVGQNYSDRSRYSQNNQNTPFQAPSASPKRDHAAAFGNKPPTTASRPKAPPAVPSFTVDIDNLLPKKTPSNPAGASAPAKKTNLLGLTPSLQESESESEAEDEEMKLAHTTTIGKHITFEHRGQKLTLRTPEEIAAWIAERRKNFPTRVKAEAAKKEAVEKKRKYEEQKKARDEAARQRREERQKERHAYEKQKVKQKMLAQVTAQAKAALAAKKADPADDARVKAEKLRKKAEKAARDLKQAEEALQRAEGKVEIETARRSVSEAQEVRSDVENPGGDHDISVSGAPDVTVEGDIDEEISSSDSSNDSGTEDTSSSGTSGSESEDSDAGPEVESSKRSGPEQVPPPSRSSISTRADAAGLPLCRNLVKFGRCKFGRRCHYSHDVPKKETKRKDKQQNTSARRKGLYQVLVEKEQDEVRRQALQTIIALGQQGLLDEASREGDTAGDSAVNGHAVPHASSQDTSS